MWVWLWVLGGERNHGCSGLPLGEAPFPKEKKESREKGFTPLFMGHPRDLSREKGDSTTARWVTTEAKSPRIDDSVTKRNRGTRFPVIPAQAQGVGAA